MAVSREVPALGNGGIDPLLMEVIISNRLMQRQMVELQQQLMEQR